MHVRMYTYIKRQAPFVHMSAFSRPAIQNAVCCSLEPSRMRWDLAFCVYSALAVLDKREHRRHSHLDRVYGPWEDGDDVDDASALRCLDRVASLSLRVFRDRSCHPNPSRWRKTRTRSCFRRQRGLCDKCSRLFVILGQNLAKQRE
jgi:hypothetical protein